MWSYILAYGLIVFTGRACYVWGHREGAQKMRESLLRHPSVRGRQKGSKGLQQSA